MPHPHLPHQKNHRSTSKGKKMEEDWFRLPFQYWGKRGTTSICWYFPMAKSPPHRDETGKAPVGPTSWQSKAGFLSLGCVSLTLSQAHSANALPFNPHIQINDENGFGFTEEYCRREFWNSRAQTACWSKGERIATVSWLWDTKILVYLTMLTFNTKTQNSSLCPDLTNFIPSPLPPKLSFQRNERNSTEMIKPVTWGGFNLAFLSILGQPYFLLVVTFLFPFLRHRVNDK